MMPYLTFTDFTLWGTTCTNCKPHIIILNWDVYVALTAHNYFFIDVKVFLLLIHTNTKNQSIQKNMENNGYTGIVLILSLYLKTASLLQSIPSLVGLWHEGRRMWRKNDLCVGGGGVGEGCMKVQRIRSARLQMYISIVVLKLSYRG